MKVLHTIIASLNSFKKSSALQDEWLSKEVTGNSSSVTRVKSLSLTTETRPDPKFRGTDKALLGLQLQLKRETPPAENG